MIQAVFSNKDHSEYGVTVIPFPIPREKYGHVMEMVKALGIGSASKQDCPVDEILGAWPVLKRLDSFDAKEAARFQAMAEKLALRSMADFINLTFCCQMATVITDFSNLEAIGLSHYMNQNDGCARMEELKAPDGHETALLFIESRTRVVILYGVVYDNNMKLAQVYNGKHFPGYCYEPNVLIPVLYGFLLDSDEIRKR